MDLIEILNVLLKFLQSIDPSLFSHILVIFITLFLSLFFNNFYIKKIERIHKEEIERLNKIHTDARASVLKAYNILNSTLSNSIELTKMGGGK